MASPPARVYCIDTSALVDLPRNYPSAVFQGTVWRSLETLIGVARLRAPREVRRELYKQDDEVYRWVRRHGSLIVGLAPQQQRFLREIMDQFPTWVDHETSQPVADPIVIALARAYNPPATVVAHENPGGAGAMKIPNVCRTYDLSCMTLPQMFVAEGWAFGGSPPTPPARRSR